MTQAYNFLGSWQLFPEKGVYEQGERPKSGTYKIATTEDKHTLRLSQSWVSLTDEAFSFEYEFVPNGMAHPMPDNTLADHVRAEFADLKTLDVHFMQGQQVVLHVVHHLLHNGYLRITHYTYREGQLLHTNQEVYHKQMSVLPYSSSVSGAVVKPNEEGVIRHKALTAMEEQTNMQLQQIRQQIELLALQAQEIQKRKELSMLVYNAKLNFQPVIGQVYYLYETHDGTHLLSMIAENEWGRRGCPFKACVAAVQLLADHTWREVM